MNGFFAELKRRNVYKVAVAYAVVAWLLIQGASILFPTFEAPAWVMKVFITAVIFGFPVALIFAWAFEITPEGIRRAEDVDVGKSITHQTGRKLVWTTAVLAVVAIALFAYQVWRSKSTVGSVISSSRSEETTASIPKKSIAVLPFENLSDNKENAFFTDGVQDEILTDLAKVADLKVISRTSVMQYKTGVQRNLREIGQQLGVAHLLEGSVQRAGNKVRVNAQLIDARTDAHQWAQSFDRDIADVFAIQTEIAKAIADQLQAKLSPSEKTAIERKPTNNVSAFDLYSRAKTLLLTTAFSAQGAQNLSQAVDLLNQAVARDPSFFQAYCLLVYSHDNLYFLGTDHTPARLALAQIALQAASRLQPEAGEAHVARAENLYRAYQDYEGARAELEIARKTLPNDPRVPELIGYIVRRQGKQDEAIKYFQRALELDPRNFFILQQVALSYQNLRRYPEMAAALDRAVAVKPGDIDSEVARASTDFDWKADTRPVHQTMDTIEGKDPAAVRTFADTLFLVGLAERNASVAERGLRELGENNYNIDSVVFNHHFCEGVIARMAKDQAKATAAFTAALAGQEKVVQG